MRCPSCGALTSQSDLFHVCRAHSDPLRQQAENAQLAAQQNIGAGSLGNVGQPAIEAIERAAYERGVAEERRRIERVADRLSALLGDVLTDDIVAALEELRRG
jgi:hypothetical protein